MSVTQTQKRPGQWVEVLVLLAILAVAAFLRLDQLDTVPPGMTHDEAAFGAEAEQILSGERPLYFSLGYGHEPLYAYLAALAFSIERSLIALRVTSALCGLAVVLFTYLLAREMLGFDAAWIAAAWMAVAFWPVSLSRQALRAITLPMLWLPAAWLLWKSLGLPPEKAEAHPVGRRALLYAGGAGILLGGSLYTYMASRVAWVVYPLFALALLLQRRTRALLRRTWPNLLLLLTLAALVALPMFLYLRAHPGAERRFGDMMGPIRELLQGKPQRVLRHAWNAVRVFSFIGDQFWAYNIPGRPVFDWIGSILFTWGLLLALWRWRTPSCAFVLLWLLTGMAPAMVTTNQGIFLRAIVAQPAAYVLVAMGTLSAGAALRRLLPTRMQDRRWVRSAGILLALALVLQEGITSYEAYFREWPSQPKARNIYNHNLVAISHALAEQPATAPAGISAMYPLYYHDPWILRYVTGRENPNVRWFGGMTPYPAGAVVYPAQGDMLYVFSALTRPDPALWDEFVSQAERVRRVELDPRDDNSSYEIWRWRGQQALTAELAALGETSPMWVSPEVVLDQPALRQALDGPARFGDVVELVGYDLSPAPLHPGDEVLLVTTWRALRTVPEQDDWTTFVHLLDPNSQLVGGIDLLHAPPSGWQPGDIVRQVHRFRVSPSAPSGPAFLEIGVYRRSTGRLAVQTSGEATHDRVLLAPLSIEP